MEASTDPDGAGATAAVLFDIDGTLVDTNYFHVVAWDRAFRQEGHQVPQTDIHRAIGMGSGQLLDALLPDRDQDRDGVLKAAHTEHYAGCFGLLRPLPGARDLLRVIAGRGARVVLATSAAPGELRALRQALDVEDALYAVTSAGDVEQAKPEPDLVAAALEAGGVGPEAALMVGDTRWDVVAAARAGLPCVGLLSGGISQVELADAGAVAVYPGPAGLLDDLDTSPLGDLLVRVGGRRVESAG